MVVGEDVPDMLEPTPPIPPVPMPRTLGGSLTILAGDIKLSHTVFAMPFALLGMVLAAGWAGRVPGWVEVLLIVACMVFARSFAMLVNRLADAEIDRGNPRTAGRALPSGRVGGGFTLAAAGFSAAGFVLAAGGFWALAGNRWPLALSVPVLVLLAFYSFAKRFTWLCHVLLGAALAASPVAAAIAIEPGFVLASAVPWLIAGAVLCWVAGFDVIYALQDVAVDRASGLFSMPASLGVEPALWVSRVLHLGVVGCLAAAWAVSPRLGPLFVGAVAVTALLLLLEHALVWRSERRAIHHAFFTVNGIISVLLGAAGVVDCLGS